MKALGITLASLCLATACSDSKTTTSVAPVPDIVLHTDFTSDPLIQDKNQDGVLDWIIRGGGTFDSTWQKDGYIAIPSFAPIFDTRPKTDYQDNTEMTCVMKAVTHDSTDTTFPRGAVCWYNVDYNYTTNDYVAASVSAVLNADGTQSVALVNYLSPELGGPATLKTVDGLPNDFLTINVHAYYASQMLGLKINGTDYGKFPMHRWPLNKDRDQANDDKFATVLGWNETAAFKSLELSVLAE